MRRFQSDGHFSMKRNGRLIQPANDVKKSQSRIGCQRKIISDKKCSRGKSKKSAEARPLLFSHLSFRSAGHCAQSYVKSRDKRSFAARKRAMRGGGTGEGGGEALAAKGEDSKATSLHSPPTHTHIQIYIYIYIKGKN
jgi:hypothetical protein